jgi:hypothetical protein
VPKVYRSMKKDTDDFPFVESSNNGLGVRINVDIDLDENGSVILNGKGMSVVPAWRKLPRFLIPERLFEKCEKARGDNDLFCFTLGTGPFEDGIIAERLYLRKDKPNHACIVPAILMHTTEFQLKLQQTRLQWAIDEE